jgi:hypothetical protein
MARAIALRCDVDATERRGLARQGKDGSQARRLLALAARIDCGPTPAIHGVVRWRLDAMRPTGRPEEQHRPPLCTARQQTRRTTGSALRLRLHRRRRLPAGRHLRAASPLLWALTSAAAIARLQGRQLQPGRLEMHPVELPHPAKADQPLRLDDAPEWLVFGAREGGLRAVHP